METSFFLRSTILGLLGSVTRKKNPRETITKENNRVVEWNEGIYRWRRLGRQISGKETEHGTWQLVERGV